MTADNLDSPAGSLANAHAGTYVCTQIAGSSDSTVRLRRIGICVNRPLAVLQGGDPVIVRVSGSHLAVSRYLARLVSLTPITQVTGDDHA